MTRPIVYIYVTRNWPLIFCCLINWLIVCFNCCITLWSNAAISCWPWPLGSAHIIGWAINIYYTVSQKSEPPKHFATATANLHRFKWNFTHTRRHLFLSSTSNFIRISYSVYRMFNSFKLLSQISVTDSTYFLLTSSVVTGVTSVRVDKQTTCYQKRIEF